MEDDCGWRDDVRLGWLVSDQAAEDGRLYAVRRDGKVVEARDRGRLMAAMVARDVIADWRAAWES